MTNEKLQSLERPAPWYRLIAPQYWGSWFSLGLLYLMVQLPYRVILKLGKTIGMLMYVVLSRRRHIAATNLQLCFPELTATERQALLKKTFTSIGTAVLETGMAWWWPARRLKKMSHIHGLENVQTTLKKGKGLLLLGGHYTVMDLGARLLVDTQSVCVVVREQNNRVIDALLKRYRNRANLTMIHRYDIRGILRHLKNNHMVWHAPDQDYGPKHSEFVPFFNVPAATITSLVRLAKISNAEVLPISYFRRDDGSGYDITFYPVLENFPSQNMADDLIRMNKIIENIIRQNPSQYLWLHRRFKTRPHNQPSFYV